MTIEQFRGVWKTDPFRPFKIHSADGRSFTVNHRDFLMQSPIGRTIIVYLPDNSRKVINLLFGDRASSIKRQDPSFKEINVANRCGQPWQTAP